MPKHERSYAAQEEEDDYDCGHIECGQVYIVALELHPTALSFRRIQDTGFILAA